MTKEEIIKDSSAFQEACGKLVRANVEQCLSNLMCSVGSNIEDCARIFDYDYDTMQGWFESTDYEEPAREAGWDEIDGEIVKRAGVLVEYPAHKHGGPNDFDYWDVIHEASTAQTVDERFELGIDFADVDDDDEAVWAALTEEQKKELIAEYREANQESADSWEDACNTDDLEPNTSEVYEHWAVSSWLGHQLEQRGEVVFEFCGMTVWGRCCSGQSIKLDSVIEDIAKDMPDYAFIWRNE